VCLELHRPEHSKARELLQAFFAEVTRWRTVAGEVNCGTCRGNCCTSHWGEYGISLSVEDSKTLAAHLGVIWNQFAQEHLISNPTPGDEQFVFKYKDEPRAPTGRCCPFLKIQEDGLGRCTVYEARPRVCREFTAYGCTIHENLPGGTK
jgi:Fe-S-cluster containining protein